MNQYVNNLVDARTQTKIKDTLTAFETGSLKGNYANIDLYDDGRNGTKQITYGKACTTEQGNLKALIKKYVYSNGILSRTFFPYLEKIGVDSLVEDNVFLQLLKEAGQDPVMQECQDIFFDEHYYFPACGFFETNKFTLPLSLLVIYDSYIQSGSILSKLRNQFTERPPVFGGSEKNWITQYVIVRHNWLKAGGFPLPDGTPGRPILKKTVYRTQCLLEQINADNWYLSKPYIANDVKIG